MLAAQPSFRSRRNGGPLPPLENGDRLTAREFLRRYEAMPHLKKAELIEGKVHMASPVRYSMHGAQDSLIQMCLSVYAAATPGVRSAVNTTIQLDVDNVPQPDSFLFIEHACGGQALLDRDGYVEGAPELVVEIAASSASIDRHEKQHAYRRNGVGEYWVWLSEEGRFEFWVLNDDRYEPLPPGTGGVLSSRAFPGLWLHTREALKLNSAAVLKTLQSGLRSRAHKEFVQRLAAARKAGRA